MIAQQSLVFNALNQVVTRLPVLRMRSEVSDTAEAVAQFLGGLVKLLRFDQRAVVIGQR